jgi:multidrug transporter EmrE-like cation transporter
MAWLLLFFGGLFEVGFTTCLHQSENLTHWTKNWAWAVGFFCLFVF